MANPKTKSPVSTLADRRAQLNPLLAFLSELHRVRDDPRLLVLVSHGVIELFVSTIAKAKCRNGKQVADDNRSYPHAVRLLILNEIRALTDSQYRLYDWFRKLRNRAAHDPVFTVTAQDLRQDFKAQYGDPSNFYKVCEQLLIGLWNKNISILAPVFMSGMQLDARGRVKGSIGPRPPAPDKVLLARSRKRGRKA